MLLLELGCRWEWSRALLSNEGPQIRVDGVGEVDSEAHDVAEHQVVREHTHQSHEAARDHWQANVVAHVEQIATVLGIERHQREHVCRHTAERVREVLADQVARSLDRHEPRQEPIEARGSDRIEREPERDGGLAATPVGQLDLLARVLDAEVELWQRNLPEHRERHPHAQIELHLRVELELHQLQRAVRVAQHLPIISEENQVSLADGAVGVASVSLAHEARTAPRARRTHRHTSRSC